MNTSELVARYAVIKDEQNKLKAEAEKIETELMKESEKDLSDTKFKTVNYTDGDGNTIAVTNSDAVKIIYPAMLKDIFGKAYSDVVKEDITYKLSEPAKKLLSAIYNGEFIRGGSIEQIVESLGLDDKSSSALAKKLKGSSYIKDVENLKKLAALDEASAHENAYLAAEAAAWQNFKRLLVINHDEVTDEIIDRAVDLIDSAVTVERTLKTTFKAADKK